MLWHVCVCVCIILHWRWRDWLSLTPSLSLSKTHISAKHVAVSLLVLKASVQIQQITSPTHPLSIRAGSEPLFLPMDFLFYFCFMMLCKKQKHNVCISIYTSKKWSYRPQISSSRLQIIGREKSSFNIQECSALLEKQTNLRILHESSQKLDYPHLAGQWHPHGFTLFPCENTWLRKECNDFDTYQRI